MEALIAEHERLSESGTLSKSLDEIQKTIDLLLKAREAVAASQYPYPFNPYNKAADNGYL